MPSAFPHPAASIAVFMALLVTPPPAMGKSGPSEQLAPKREARSLLAVLIASGDYTRARSIAAEAGPRRVDQGVVLLNPVEAALFGTLVGDFGFLSAFCVSAGPPTSNGPGQDNDALAEALMLKRQEARALAAQITGLSAEERRFVELLLASATRPAGVAPRFERSPAVEAEAESFLQAFPATVYRRFLINTLMEHYRPGRWAYHMAVSLAAPGLRGGRLDPLGSGPLCFGHLGVSYHGATFGFLALQQGLCEGDGLDAFSLGYRASAGRHRIVASLGVGPEHSTQAADPVRQAPARTVAFGSEVAAVEYQLAYGAVDRARERSSYLLTVGLIAVRPISVSRDLAAFHLILQVGVGMELATHVRVE